jgi:3-oxo-5alpha-steroid 4-dehydrogenase
MEGTSMPEPLSTSPRKAAEVPSWDLEADVVIVGFSMAGASAALGALEVTDDVLALERGGGPEGTCGGIVYLGGGTPMQKAMGFDDTADEMYNFLLAALGPGVDEEKLRVYCDESLLHFDWLTGNGVPLMTGPDEPGSMLASPEDDGFINVGGQEYAGGGLVWTGGEQAHPFSDRVRPAPRGHIPRDPDSDEDLFEGAVLKCLVRAAEEKGVRTEYNLGVQRLVVDEEGTVVGVEGRRFGDVLRVRARRGVVLTTGGFIYNDSMLATHSPAMLAVSKLGHGGQDGLGIQMAQATGADAIHMDTADITLVLTPPMSYARGILFNALGRRFINEDTYYGRLGAEAAYRQDAIAYLLLDESTFLDSGWRRPTWTGDSVAELETEMGLPTGALAGTVAYYNEHAARGADPLFHKGPRWLQPLVPPYAVIDLRQQSFPMSAFTMGGLRTAVGGEVLRPDSSPIAGLYAAGRATSALAVSGYCSGISLGDCSFFGRRAGQSAATSS